MSAKSRTKEASGEREFSKLIFEHLGVTLARNLAQTRDGRHDLASVAWPKPWNGARKDLGLHYFPDDRIFGLA